ncbi:efflux RND transporter permease subunit [Legionella sp. W05-934-2]|uniref:efflux RND transporter permease subunit n=1 Tax=Legionella sp. W05-934-2 TaxID=1198649 RepID=UPI00346187DC
MRIREFSVKRPILAVAMSLLLVLFGIIAVNWLHQSVPTDIDPPIIAIETAYPGAGAQTVENDITKVIEKKISGVKGIRFVDSKSINGLSTLKIEFRLSRDIEEAANEIREKVSGLLDELPDGAEPPDVFKVNSNDDVIMWFNLISQQWSSLQLMDYADKFLVDRLASIEGVSHVRIGGERRYAMQIKLDSKAMDRQNVSLKEIYDALKRNNIELPGERIESYQYEFPVWLNHQFNSINDFANLVIRKKGNGHVIHLNDVATVNKDDELLRNGLHGHPKAMVGLGIIKKTTAKTLDVNRHVHKVVDSIQLPGGMTLITSYDSSELINESTSKLLSVFFIALLLFGAISIRYSKHISTNVKKMLR